MSAFLFVSDLDNTFVGDDTALATLQQYLKEHRETHGTKVVYATGRSLQLYQDLAQEKSLMTPDALITSVGTEIYLDPSHIKYDQSWSEILSQGWNREKISEIAGKFAELTPQPHSEQNPFKVSYYLSEKDAVTVIPSLKAHLSQSGLQTKLVYSGSHDLDILPINGDKGLALKYLREKWKVEPDKTVACGDSGNDIALFQGMERGIIVGNARNELREWYISHQKPHHYLSTASYAGGILEGLKHFGFLS
jgi:hypothetical protein